MKQTQKQRLTEGQKTIDRLVNEGWFVHHSALVSIYRYAGAVSPMQTRKGYDYCRVHLGQTVGSLYNYQITTVMYRLHHEWK